MAENRAKYEELKAQLTETYGLHFVDQLRAFARELNAQDDCNAFLSQVEPQE